MKKSVMVFGVVMSLLLISFVSASWFGDLFNKNAGEEMEIVGITGKAIDSTVPACPSMPCFFDGESAVGYNNTLGDSPPEYISANYPYEFNLLVPSNVTMILKYAVWRPWLVGFRQSKSNSISVKIDDIFVFGDKSTSNSKSWMQQDINISNLSSGMHTIEIYASPYSKNFVFDWFNLTAIPLAVCKDSDGGRNYSIKGNVTRGSDTIAVDFCHDDGVRLDEVYCSDDQITTMSEEYDCSSEGKVCKDGACVEKDKEKIPSTCEESDGGLNLYKKGSIKIVQGAGTITGEDSCFDVPFDIVDGTSNLDVLVMAIEKGVKIEKGFNGEYLMETTCRNHTLNGAKTYDVAVSYKCPYGCEDGACIEEDIGSKSCKELKEFIKSPKNFKLNYDKWILEYNSSWEYDDEADYYASFSQSSDYGYNYVSLSLRELGDTKEVDSMLNEAVEYGLCQQEKIYNYNSENYEDYKIVYLCKSIWDIAQNNKNLYINTNNANRITAMWVSGNSVFEIYSSNYYYSPYYDYESYKELEEERHRQQQEKIVDFLGKLISNEEEYVGGFYLPWKSEQFVSLFLFSCGSDIVEEEYEGSWSCKLEPAICPPHGEQKEICTRWNYKLGKEEVREAEIYCSPGICAGCYVPKWFGEYGNNKCIPYGFRFEQQVGWNIKEVYSEDKDSEGLTVKQANKYKEVDLVVYENNTALLTLETEQETYVNIPLEQGTEYDWDEIIGEVIDTEGDMDFTLYVDEIFYDSEDYEDSFISIIFYASGFSKIKTPEFINAYCDIDGKIKEQKTKEYGGIWARCQNNYECESNLCSSGECVEINDMIESASSLKKVWVRIACRFNSILTSQTYEDCLAESLGEDYLSSLK
jgi:hypothetical protein